MKASEEKEEKQDEKRPKPVFQESSSLYPNLIDLETKLFPPLYADPHLPLLPQVPQVSSGEARRRAKPSAPPRERGPAQGTWGRTREVASAVEVEGPEIPSSTVHAFPWPFSTSDLYNWKTQTPSFSEKPQGLIDLLESILFTHNPTWDDCQQLLQVLFTTEECKRILLEAWKNVPGVDGRPTIQPNLIEEGFPLVRPHWDFKRAEGRERLRVYRQTLVAGLRVAARKPTNLAKVNSVRQEPNESPAAFLERIMEAFRQYTPMDPQADESRAAVMLAFVNQAAPNIRKKLQKIERLGEQSLQDLVRAAERVFNHRETPEEREDRIRREEKYMYLDIKKGTAPWHEEIVPQIWQLEKRLMKILLLRCWRSDFHPPGPVPLYSDWEKDHNFAQAVGLNASYDLANSTDPPQC
ncbi:uncharacterized protein LOC128059195 [Budorcas taxicolor]|uniref:uncharacterized protein LOC128059195 n=1 Tax=Budorcas taxicolor TaxID=37181 RepID=UPI0022845651|nr:uncharacterized protein LOC128059195 [Budorcas taxicolor]